MATNLYIGNLSFQTTEDAIRDLFTEHGEVESVRLITDRYTGRSRGFAFVEMATDEAAQAAIEALNGKAVDERELRVEIAKPKRDRRDDRRGSRW
ncbi:MAG: RNA-binding protein [Anaerolineae bacterium]|jgi:RNA recognition motif-containing protein